MESCVAAILVYIRKWCLRCYCFTVSVCCLLLGSYVACTLRKCCCTCVGSFKSVLLFEDQTCIRQHF
uniref:Putative ovule protein n=1 Tax=Solanum chacoense TaxID=4108 RepID=A0A0V0GUN4_SOLCH